jgi:hypothetical protein
MDDKISADNEVDESRLLLFKAHAVVTIAAAAAVSETPSHPQHRRGADQPARARKPAPFLAPFGTRRYK